ncbi:MAG: ribosome silencing factor [Gammaproteobacteria bacterium]|nr:MAG: ribosome silencing factor [Gammaproteobacteria bacterium]
MKHTDTVKIAVNALENMKGVNIAVIDTQGKTDAFDAMIVVTGTSDRHVKSLADNVVKEVKSKSLGVLGVEQDRSWVLVDLYDVIVHIMLEETREFYSLEKLWEISTDRIQVS